MEEFYLPEKWRNKVFRFQAGGYDGCICHPAALIVDRDGDVHLVESDGGAGGLDENDWYCRSCRAYLDEKGVATEDAFLYGSKKNMDFYKEFQELRKVYTAERKRRERQNVLEALEEEWGKDSNDIRGWDHEFELIGEIDTKDKVREVCRKLGDFFYDVYYRAEIADALRSAEYDGAGFICTACGKYTEDSDYESFTDHIDRDSYHGIGGLAVAHTAILCDSCRQDIECPQCYEMTRHPSSEGDTAYDHMTFREAFIVQWLGVCEYCADSFFRDNKYEHWDNDMDKLEETIDNAKDQLRKYIEIMREGGMSEQELAIIESRNYVQCEETWRTLVNELRDKMEEDVSAFFHKANDWAGDRLMKGKHYVW
ncbi:MAG: hypothetical protein PUF61_11095 [Spirochaetales bacterium]|nr:hypothetical protein [Spirochaetales bacterium]